MLVRIELLNVAENEDHKARVVEDITEALATREPEKCENPNCEKEIDTCPHCGEVLPSDDYPFQVKVELDDGIPRCGM